MFSLGKGSSKKLRQAAMCVVNKKGRIESNTGTSIVPTPRIKIVDKSKMKLQTYDSNLYCKIVYFELILVHIIINHIIERL